MCSLEKERVRGTMEFNKRLLLNYFLGWLTVFNLWEKEVTLGEMRVNITGGTLEKVQGWGLGNVCFLCLQF